MEIIDWIKKVKFPLTIKGNIIQRKDAISLASIGYNEFFELSSEQKELYWELRDKFHFEQDSKIKKELTWIGHIYRESLSEYADHSKDFRISCTCLCSFQVYRSKNGEKDNALRKIAVKCKNYHPPNPIPYWYDRLKRDMS